MTSSERAEARATNTIERLIALSERLSEAALELRELADRERQRRREQREHGD